MSLAAMTFGDFLPIFGLALAAIAIAVAAMAIGVMFRRPCLRGSCGGPAVSAPDGTPLSCAGCPRRKRREASASAPTPPTP